jgi:hypothetical protein
MSHHIGSARLQAREVRPGDGSVVTQADIDYGRLLDEVQALVGFTLANALGEAVSERLCEAHEQGKANGSTS